MKMQVLSRTLTSFCLNLLSICTFALPAIAQEDTTVLELKNVTITENRMQTPFSESARSISVISRQQIEDTPGQSLAEVLSNVAGVDIRQRGPAGVQADASIRGGSFEQTLILINGVKMSDPQTGHHLMNLPVDKDNIERIEVIKGPGARIYGQNAFSGAINIITKVPENKQVVAGAYGGDFTTYGGNIGVALPAKTYGQYISVAGDHSDGYSTNTDYTIGNLFYQSYLKTAAGQFNFIGGYTSRAFGATGFYVPESEEFEKVKTTFVSADYQGKVGNWTFQPRLYWRRNHDDYIFKRSDPDYYHNIHTTHVIGAEFNATNLNSLGLSGLGAEFRKETIASTNLGNRERRTAGFFAEHRFYLLNKLDITPGLYLNWYSDYGWNFFPGLDASYDVSSSLKAFANVGKSFRIPTYTDLYYHGPSNIGNAQLKPEKAWTYEGGFKYFTKNFWGQISYFQRDASQLIDWVRSNSDEPWQPMNFYHVNAHGIETGIHFIFSKPSWIQNLDLDYTYLNAALKNPEGIESHYALENLKHQLLFSVTHKIFWQIRHTFRARYLDRVTQKDYFVMDDRIYFQGQKLTIYAEATNLTNTSYKEAGYVTMPGRWFRAGVNIKVGF